MRILTLVLLLAAHGPLSAQITYTRVQRNGAITLREMRSNGSNDTAINFPSNRVGFPTWSRDGTLLAVTAFRPKRVPTRTWNVYGIVRRNGAVRKLTDYLDILDPDTSTASYTFPYYKAFSRNGRALATFSLTQSGGGNSGGIADVPVLEIHSLTGTANPILVHVDKGRNGRHHGGEGVDWSPTRNILAAPLESAAPFLSGGGPGQTTAIFLIPPVQTAVLQGQARQITFPRADANITTAIFWTEHDYQPKFSPSGGRLVYVRSFQLHALGTSQNPDPNIQSLRILNLNTGEDREIRRFPQGTYITTVDWSPDGNRLVFDLALQANGPFGPMQQGSPETNQIYIMDATGARLVQLRGNGNGTPAWRK